MDTSNSESGSSWDFIWKNEKLALMFCINEALTDLLWPKDESGNDIPEDEVSETDYQHWVREMEEQRYRFRVLKRDNPDEYESEVGSLLMLYSLRNPELFEV